MNMFISVSLAFLFWCPIASASKVLKCDGDAKIVEIDRSKLSKTSLKTNGTIKITKLNFYGPCDLKADKKVIGEIELAQEKTSLRVGDEVHFQSVMICGPKAGCKNHKIFLY
jgi:hypothetical protein